MLAAAIDHLRRDFLVLSLIVPGKPGALAEKGISRHRLLIDTIPAFPSTLSIRLVFAHKAASYLSFFQKEGENQSSASTA